MDEHRKGAIAPRQLVRRSSRNSRRVGGRAPHEAAAYLRSIGTDDADGIARTEVTAHADDADG